MEIHLDYRAWSGLLFGLVVFSLWPLALYLGGKFYIFENWFNFTIMGSILKSRGVSIPWYTYLVFLFKSLNIIFLFSLVGIYRNITTEKSKLINLCIITFFTILITLSLQGLKYSNYLIPLYPFIAILAAFGMNSLWRSSQDRVLSVFRYLIPITGLVLLIFPITNKTSRDPEITKLKELMSYSSFTPSKWIVYNQSYPYWSLASKNGYEDGSGTIPVNRGSDIEMCSSCIVLVKSDDSKELLGKESFSNFYEKVFILKKRNINVYIPREASLRVLSF